MFASTGKKMLSRSVLKEKIEGFLLTQSVCVLATALNDVPRASAVEFFPDGLYLYILTEGGKKLNNIKKNPLVSLEVFAPYTGWGTVQGLQVEGTAEVGKKGSEIFAEGERAYGRRRGQENIDLPGFIHVIRIRPLKMEYLDARLDRRGYAVRQALKIEPVSKKKTVKAKKKTTKTKEKISQKTKTSKKKTR